jgi:hypothetical protein
MLILWPYVYLSVYLHLILKTGLQLKRWFFKRTVFFLSWNYFINVKKWTGNDISFAFSIMFQALADPYFVSLANVEREPSRHPISKLEFEFERRKLIKDDVRELIYREVGINSFGSPVWVNKYIHLV